MENNLPEKSSSFNKRDVDVEVDDINSETGTSLPVEESAKFSAEEKPTATETDIKEEKPDDEDDPEYQKNAEIENIESQDAPPPLEIQYTVETALEDVDCFLTTLCAPNGEDEESSLNIPGFVEKYLDLVEETIVKLESGEFKAKWDQLADDDITFLGTEDRISKLNISISKIKYHQNHSLLINRICGIQQRATCVF